MIQEILDSKQKHRRKKADEPLEKKLEAMDKLREGSIKASNRVNKESTEETTQAKDIRFPGRSTSSGIDYEVRLATCFAVKMLSGKSSSVFEGISGDQITSIQMQTKDPVDDVVLNLEDDNSRIFISAKLRSQSLNPNTNLSSEFGQIILSFVEQYLAIEHTGSQKCRLVLALPLSAGKSVAQDLPRALNAHRNNTNTESIEGFLSNRPKKEKKALSNLIAAAKASWKKVQGSEANEEDFRSFLRIVYVEQWNLEDHEQDWRNILGDIRTHIAECPEDSLAIRDSLVSKFQDADTKGYKLSAQSIREHLLQIPHRLKAPPDYASEINKLKHITQTNLERIKAHVSLHFGKVPAESVSLERDEELEALCNATKAQHLLLTGEPGCGKTGLLCKLANQLQSNGTYVIVLLAEALEGVDMNGSANVLGLNHPLPEILANWSPAGILITDALDALRDGEQQSKVRKLLEDITTGNSDWTVLASVREFDLMHSHNLRRIFPGTGVLGYSHPNQLFSDVSHFYLSGFKDAELNYLGVQQPSIRAFLEKAKVTNLSIRHSPFYLNLAAELLGNGTSPETLSDWQTPTQLMGKYWETRVDSEHGYANHAFVEKVCQNMMDKRRMQLPEQGLGLNEGDRLALATLRSSGVLQPTNDAGGTIAFSHHLLHDFAIARTLVPKICEDLCEFLEQDVYRPIFYRQSFLFTLEEIWMQNRHQFWEITFNLESRDRLHGTTKIQAPVFGAKRIEDFCDTKPLLEALKTESSQCGKAHNVLRHLLLGMEDVDPELIVKHSIVWAAFAKELSGLLNTKPWLEPELAHLLKCLNHSGFKEPLDACRAVNIAAGNLLEKYLTLPVGKGSRFVSHHTIEALCRSFAAYEENSEALLLSLMSNERLKHFPTDDLLTLADNLGYLGKNGTNVITSMFQHAFASEPEPGEWENRGGTILGLRMQTSDMWHGIHFSLEKYYLALDGGNPSFMTELICIIWNTVLCSGRSEHQTEIKVTFRNEDCPLYLDLSHITSTYSHHHESAMLNHFEKCLEGWASNKDTPKLEAALDTLKKVNRNSLLWSVCMEVGAKFPDSLGILLRELLDEPTILTEDEYCYAGTELFGALHTKGSKQEREQLEKLILNLPNSFRLEDDEKRSPTPYRVTNAQDRLLGTLKESKIVNEATIKLLHSRKKSEATLNNTKRGFIEAKSRKLTDSDFLREKGIDETKESVKSMMKTRTKLKPEIDHNDPKSLQKTLEAIYLAIIEAEQQIENYSDSEPEMTQDLWGYLIGACQTIAAYANWGSTDKRWDTIQKLLLKASTDPDPVHSSISEDDTDSRPSFEWPAPRLDSARGLISLTYKLGSLDANVENAIVQLSKDHHNGLRLELAQRIRALWKVSPKLMWRLYDDFSNHEQNFTVLRFMLHSMEVFWGKENEELKKILRVLAGRIKKEAQPTAHFHKQLAQTYMRGYLWEGDEESREFIWSEIKKCYQEPESKALLGQLHLCRAGGWLTSGEPGNESEEDNLYRQRVLEFFMALLDTAKKKLDENVPKLFGLDVETIKNDPAKHKIRNQNSLCLQIIDGIASQLYFGSGAFEERKNNEEKVLITSAHLTRFWEETSPLLKSISISPRWANTADQIVQILCHLLPVEPSKIFYLSTQCIMNAKEAGLQFERLALKNVLKLVERAFADHKEIFQVTNENEPNCLKGLLDVLDLFTEAGWQETRQFIFRLEEIYR